MKPLMKTFVMALAGILLFSLGACTKKDAPDDTPGASPFHPPQWIQGSWKYQDAYVNISNTYTFTEDDIVLKSNANGHITEYSFKEYADTYEKVDENITDTEYEFTIHYIGSHSTDTYRFVLLNPQTITETAHSAVHAEYVKQ